MKRIVILNVFTVIFLLCSQVAAAKINTGKTACSPGREHASFIQVMPDTIPVVPKPAEATTANNEPVKPVVTVIKEVPKARKVSVPKPVTIKVKPVKIIKPKIIKPLVKVL